MYAIPDHIACCGDLTSELGQNVKTATTCSQLYLPLLIMWLHGFSDFNFCYLYMFSLCLSLSVFMTSNCVQCSSSLHCRCGFIIRMTIIFAQNLPWCISTSLPPCFCRWLLCCSLNICKLPYSVFWHTPGTASACRF